MKLKFLQLKKALCAALLMAFFAPWAAQAQETVTIGEGTSSGNNCPFGTYYNYSITEQLYTAEEIGMAGEILSISFYYNGTAAKDFPIDVYMQNVNATDLSTGISLTEAEQVFSGTLSVTTNAGWVTIVLDTPFYYDGTSNLLIGFNKGYVYYFSGNTWRYTSASNMARYSQNDNNAYSLSTVPGTVTNNRPNIQIEIAPDSGSTCPKPYNLDVAYEGGTTAIVTWNSNNSVDLKVNGTEFTNVTSPYNLVNLELNRVYNVVARANCGEGDYSEWTNVFSFATAACQISEQIQIRYELVDGYGDGWNNCAINVVDENCNTIETLTIESGNSATGYLSLCSGAYYSFEWMKGSYPDETSWTFYDTNDEDVLFLGSGSSSMQTGDIIYTMNAGSCARPSDLVVEAIDPYSVTLDWTENGEASAWEVAYMSIDDNDFTIVSANNSTDFTIQDLSPLTIYIFKVRANCGAETSIWSCPVNFTTPNPCQAPTDITVNFLDGHTAMVSWTSDATAWDIKVGTEVTENITNPYILNNLELDTDYHVWVRSNCEGGSISGWSNMVSFTTPQSIPLVEPFANTSIPSGWIRYSGLLSDVIAGGTLTSTTSGWGFNTGNGVFDNHAILNIYNTNRNYWLVTPNMAFDENAILRFDLALTQYDGTLQPVSPGQQEDDKFVVLITTDGGTTWEILRQWDNEGSEYVYDNIACSATGEVVEIDLSTYVGQSIALAFYGESTQSGGDNNLHIDNVNIDFKPVCWDMKTQNVTLSNLVPRMVTVGWDVNGGAMEWKVQCSSDANFVDDLHEAIATAPTWTYNDLEPETNYYVRVAPLCVDANDYTPWSEVISFTTPIACPKPTDLTVSDVNAYGATLDWEGESESYNVIYRSIVYDGEQFDEGAIPEGWNRYTGLLEEVLNGTTTLSYATSGWSFGTANGVFDSHARTNIYGSSWNKWLVTPTLEMVDDVQLSFDLALTVYTSGSNASPTPGQQADDKFVVLITTDDGFNWEILRQWDNIGSEYVYDEIPNTGTNVIIDLSSYAGQSVAIAFYGESTVSGGDNNLHIDNVGCIGGISEWVTENTELTTYTLNELTPATIYQVKVQGVCGDELSKVAETSFTTLPACIMPTEFAVNGTVGAREVTLGWISEAEAWQIVCSDDELADPNTLEPINISENPYILTNLTPETTYYVYLRTVCDESLYSTWCNVSFTTDISCYAPTDLMYTAVTPTTATLVWTESAQATEWTVQYSTSSSFESYDEANASGTPSIVLTDLIPETVYYARVKAVCDEGDESLWSNTCSFEPTVKITIGYGTATNKYLPTRIHYNYSLTQQIYTAEEIGQAGAITSIDFYLDAYTSRDRYLDIYLVNTDKASFESQTDWIPVASDDLYYRGYVNFTENGWTTLQFDGAFIYDGVSNLAIIVDDNSGHYESDNTPFRVFEAQNQAIRIYSDDTNYNPMEPEAYNGTIESSKNQIRLLFGEEPTCFRPTDFVVTDVTGYTANLTWSSDAEAWQIAYTTSSYDNPDDLEHIDVAENPYELTGLESTTTYYAFVRANCGEEYSAWTRVIFTTPIFCAAPTDLICTAVGPTTATLSWTYEGDATEWLICINDDTDNLITTTENTFTLTDLETEEVYSAKVRANCGEGQSTWSNTIYFEPTNKICIGFGPTSTNNNLPTNVYYKHSLTQQIYTAEEIGAAGTILSIDFKYEYYDAPTRNLNIYMVQTDKTSYDNNTDWIAVTNDDLVFSGQVTFNDYDYYYSNYVGWTTIELNKAFAYDGESNLAIIVDDNTGSYIGSNRNFLSYAATNQALAVWSDDVDYNPANPLDYEGTIQDSKNQIRIFMVDVPSCLQPTDFTVDYDNIAPRSADLVWTDEEASAWQIRLNHNTIIDVTENPYTLQNLTPETTYTVQIRTNCGDDEYSLWSFEQSFTTPTECAVPEITNVTNITHYGATVNWSGDSDKYVFQYREANNPEDDWHSRTTMLTYTNLINLTLDTQYEVRVRAICSDFSDVATFTTMSGDIKFFMTEGSWATDNNWEPVGAPTVENDVEIRANVTIPSGVVAEANNITVVGNNTITINDGGQLKTSSNVFATVVKNITGYTGEMDNYYLITNPLYTDYYAHYGHPSNYGMIAIESAYDLYRFDYTEDEEWRNYEANNFFLYNGIGYLYANSADLTINFTGMVKANNEPEVVNLNFSSYYYNFNGWNLLGNPFVCNVYLNMPYFRMGENGDEIVAGNAGTAIAPMEGFFVQADGHGQSVNISREAPVGDKGALNINLSKANTFTDRAIVHFGEGKALGKFQLNPNHTKVYISQEGKDYAVVNAGEVGEIPVSFKAETNGSYTLSFTNEEVSFSYLRLIDNMTGVETNLLETPYYTFNAQTTDYASRFRLVFATGSSIDGDSFGFINGAGNLSIFGIEGEATVQVVDVLGHILSSETFNGSYEEHLDVAPGVYMLRLIQGDDVKVQKMVIK